MPENNDITVLLSAVSRGEEKAPQKLLPLVYDDLRRLAAAYFRNEQANHTLQPTALVHEAYLRLVDWKNVDWKNKAQFFAVAARVMRNILVDHARARNSRKRDAGQRISLDDAISFSNEKDFDLLVLEDVLMNLEKRDARQAKIVELRFFGGLTIQETAYVLNISEATVKNEWAFAKAWFQRELAR